MDTISFEEFVKELFGVELSEIQKNMLEGIHENRNVYL